LQKDVSNGSFILWHKVHEGPGMMDEQDRTAHNGIQLALAHFFSQCLFQARDSI
jgi:hypothetical protein